MNNIIKQLGYVSEKSSLLQTDDPDVTKLHAIVDDLIYCVTNMVEQMKKQKNLPPE